jgi:hypothetical protein
MYNTEINLEVSSGKHHYKLHRVLSVLSLSKAALSNNKSAYNLVISALRDAAKERLCCAFTLWRLLSRKTRECKQWEKRH